MKKIINGRLYNTETARCICEYTNGLGASDFHNLTKMLYRKKTGEYFFHVVGGPLSEAAERYGGLIHSGEKLKPISDSEALEFAERVMSVEDYIKEFGEVSE